MVVRDERDPAAGALTAGLTGAQWAWKFLRRNTDYRQDWSKSITVWRELEAAYSAPPRHGFAAWRKKPPGLAPGQPLPRGGRPGRPE